jgi:hypothetical protein
MRCTSRNPVRYALAALAVGIGLLLSVIPAHRAAGAQPAGPPMTRVAEAVKRFHVAGTVIAVDYVTNTVRVKTGDGEVAISITPTTSIACNGENGSISDIRRGSRISVSGVILGGQWVANAVIVH